jgi:hypothetical protein
MRRATPTIASIRGQKFGQIEPVNDLDHEPREVILRQPLTQARRQQQLLLAITRQEVLRHTPDPLKPPGQHLRATAATQRNSADR